MLVVLPTPFTPTTKMTAGMPGGGCLALGAAESAPGFSRIARIPCSTAGRNCAVSRSLPWLICCFSRPRISCVVRTPRSAVIRVASRSSSTDSSRAALPSTISSIRSTSWALVEATACFSRSRKPGFFSSLSPEPNREIIRVYCSRSRRGVRSQEPECRSREYRTVKQQNKGQRYEGRQATPGHSASYTLSRLLASDA